MSLISEEMFLRDNLQYKFEEIETGQDSYWKSTELDYGIEDYDFEDVNELKQKIKKVTGVGSECAKQMAVEAFKRHFNKVINEDGEEQEIEVPDFVYRL